MKAKDVMNILGITRGTLYNYAKDGTITYTVLDNGYYDYHEDSVFKIMKKDKRQNVIYARVSTYKQKKDLDTQVKKLKSYCNDNKINVDKVFSEIASGIDFDRTQFNLLIELVLDYKVKNIYISNKDRLTRLSFKTIKFLFSKFYTNIIVVNDIPNQSNDNEIFQELISIIHIFSTTMYSNRRKNKMKIISDDIENFIDTS